VPVWVTRTDTPVCMRERGGWGREGESSEAPSLLSYTLRYVSFAELGHMCQFGLREPMHLVVVYYKSKARAKESICTCVHLWKVSFHR
jgi:hypothetical protein